MSLVHRIRYRAERDYFRWKYNRVARRIMATRPLARGTVPFILLSMVQKRDVAPYLVALKSFAHFVNPARVVVVCDPSIDQDDRAVFKRHVPHIELRDAHEFTHQDIPRGGTWERLFAISGYAEENYVIQLDADTVTVHPIPEVRDAVLANAGFVISEMADAPARTLQATHENAKQWMGESSPHIQALAEFNMVDAGLPDTARYIRGCSGFTGFPRGAGMRDTMTDYSRRMTSKLGEGWKRWGTEQVTSNYLISNMPGTRPLPFPKYGTPDDATADTAFYHFIGSMRFNNNRYEMATRHALGLINGAAA